jgi:hypothetical protein
MPRSVLRVVLFVLASFVAFTAIYGAFFVIPDLPPEWLDGGPFPDYMIPSLALGLIVGPLAIASAIAVIVRPELAGAVAMVAGATMIAFELVEVAVVGLAIVEYGTDQPVAWLQIVYLVVGLVQLLVGYALWRATAPDRERWLRTGHHVIGSHS